MNSQQIFQIALQHHQAGRLAEAEVLYRQILAAEPRHAEALHFLGIIAHQVGRNDVAEDLIRQAIALNPNQPDAYSNLGIVLKEMGRLDEAITACRQAIAACPDYPDAHINLGNALKNKGQLDEAIAAYREAIALKPDFALAYRNLGNALKSNGRLDEAIATYHQAIALQPDHPEAHCNLGTALKDKGRLDEAIAACRQAIALKPNYPDAHINLGNILHITRQLDKAIHSYHQAIAFQPNDTKAHSNLGNVLCDKGQLDEAIAAYRQAIALQPDFPEVHKNLALALLLRGDFHQGWIEYEWRWKCEGFAAFRRDFPQPQWDGGPLAGRTLLLHAEQGFGDAIQFIRYLPLVAERGGKIIIECQPELHRLLQTMGADFPIVAKGQPLPAFDVHCPFLSLPRLFASDLTNIPRDVPYLRANIAEAAIWRDRFADHSSSLKVGLVWAGSPTHQRDRSRSLNPASLAPLAQVPGVRFVSLQKGGVAAGAGTPPAGMELIDVTQELKDFADTAALIAALDLVIAVDTAVAHLAGAMGKPVWTLLPFVPDWRWLLGRSDSPWYPTMRLFRQQDAGDWEHVVAEVRRHLETLAAGRS